MLISQNKDTAYPTRACHTPHVSDFAEALLNPLQQSHRAWPQMAAAFSSTPSTPLHFLPIFPSSHTNRARPPHQRPPLTTSYEPCTTDLTELSLYETLFRFTLLNTVSTMRRGVARFEHTMSQGIPIAFIHACGAVKGGRYSNLARSSFNQRVLEPLHNVSL